MFHLKCDGKNYTVKIEHVSFENVQNFKYLVTAAKDKLHSQTQEEQVKFNCS